MARSGGCPASSASAPNPAGGGPASRQDHRLGTILIPARAVRNRQGVRELSPSLSDKAEFEVLGRCSNHADHGERIARILLEAPSMPAMPISRTTKQVHRLLVAAQIEELAAAYRSRATLVELGQRFHVHRDNTSRALDLHGTPRRYRLLGRSSIFGPSGVGLRIGPKGRSGLLH